MNINVTLHIDIIVAVVRRLDRPLTSMRPTPQRQPLSHDIQSMLLLGSTAQFFAFMMHVPTPGQELCGPASSWPADARASGSSIQEWSTLAARCD